MKKLITLVLVLTGIVSCNPSNNTVETPESFLSGNNWYLKKIYLPTGNIDVPGNIANLKFDAEKKSAGGKGGCNNYGTKYTISNNTINFKDLFSTKMFCEKYQETENKYFSQLEKVTRYEVMEGKLLMYMDKELLLEFGK